MRTGLFIGTIDTNGDTIDLRYSSKSDKPAAKQFFIRTLSQPHEQDHE